MKEEKENAEVLVKEIMNLFVNDCHRCLNEDGGCIKGGARGER